MRIRLVVLGLVAALAGTGCGGTSKHAAVTGYINQVNDVEKRMAVPLALVTQTNRTFARGRDEPRLAAQLKQSETTLRTLRRRLAKLSPPPEAKRLHALLLELVDRQVDLAQQVERIQAFVPRYKVTLAPLAPADVTLKKQLAVTVKGAAAAKELDAAKASELDAYAATVDHIAANLRRLTPPDVWRPAYETQLGSLTALHDSARALAHALRASRARDIPALLRRFDVAAVANQSIAAQKRQIAAVARYDARIKTLVSLAREVQTERARLQRAYG
jgi:hypothetical protein